MKTFDSEVKRAVKDLHLQPEILDRLSKDPMSVHVDLTSQTKSQVVDAWNVAFQSCLRIAIIIACTALIFAWVIPWSRTKKKVGVEEWIIRSVCPESKESTRRRPFSSILQVSLKSCPSQCN